MSKHVTVSTSEPAGRLAILELVEAYAHCADRRDAKGEMSLLTPYTPTLRDLYMLKEQL